MTHILYPLIFIQTEQLLQLQTFHPMDSLSSPETKSVIELSSVKVLLVLSKVH